MGQFGSEAPVGSHKPLQQNWDNDCVKDISQNFMEKDVFHFCQWGISVLLSTQYSDHDVNSLSCSKHGFTNDIFLLLTTM